MDPALRVNATSRFSDLQGAQVEVEDDVVVLNQTSGFVLVEEPWNSRHSKTTSSLNLSTVKGSGLHEGQSVAKQTSAAEMLLVHSVDLVIVLKQ